MLETERLLLRKPRLDDVDDLLEFAGDGEGIETGVDLDALVATSEWLEGVLGRRLEGYVYRAGSWP